MHKAKGKEFNNVFLMLENFNPDTDEAKRLLYVAMTRAKQNLTIHLNENYLDDITVDKLERTDDDQSYLPPGKIAMHLTFKDVWLDYFISKQHLISPLVSGDEIKINGDECTNFKGQSLLKFSKQFLNTIETHKQKGYQLKEVKVNFILYWKKEGAEQEIKIILPEVYFERD